MEFRNLTPFPAIAFDGIDPFDAVFHVIVVRQTLSFATGTLAYADIQHPFCEADVLHDALAGRAASDASVAQESDFCAYKPRCDVIINATAYAPIGTPAPHFTVGINVTTPKKHVLVDKKLVVTGPRYWQKKRRDWTLSTPEPITSLPLRYEFSYGGQCLIDSNDEGAASIAPADQLTPDQLTPDQRDQHPDAVNPPLAHAVWAANLVGMAFAPPWYFKTKQPAQWPAPQIELPESPLNSELFGAIIGGTAQDDHPALQPAGLSAWPKSHPARIARAGIVDQAFVKSERALPADFDFAVWNAAPQDQQTELLHGDESFALTNLCKLNVPGSRIEGENTLLEFTLPAHECYVLIHLKTGQVEAQPLQIDTVLIEPDNQRVTLVWRGRCRKIDAAPVEVLEVRMRSHDEKRGDYGGARLDIKERRQRLTRGVINRINNAVSVTPEISHG